MSDSDRKKIEEYDMAILELTKDVANLTIELDFTKEQNLKLVGTMNEMQEALDARTCI